MLFLFNKLYCCINLFNWNYKKNNKNSLSSINSWNEDHYNLDEIFLEGYKHN